MSTSRRATGAPHCLEPLMHHLSPLRPPAGRSPLAVAAGIAVILLLFVGLAAALTALRGETPPPPVVMAGAPAAVAETVPAAAASVDATIDATDEQPPTF